MQGKNQLSMREQRTHQAESQESPTNISSDVNMDDPRLFLKNQANHPHRTRRIVNPVAFPFSMTSQIDYFTADLLPIQEILERG